MHIILGFLWTLGLAGVVVGPELVVGPEVVVGPDVRLAGGSSCSPWILVDVPVYSLCSLCWAGGCGWRTFSLKSVVGRICDMIMMTGMIV